MDIRQYEESLQNQVAGVQANISGKVAGARTKIVQRWDRIQQVHETLGTGLGVLSGAYGGIKSQVEKVKGKLDEASKKAKGEQAQTEQEDLQAQLEDRAGGTSYRNAGGQHDTDGLEDNGHDGFSKNPDMTRSRLPEQGTRAEAEQYIRDNPDALDEDSITPARLSDQIDNIRNEGRDRADADRVSAEADDDISPVTSTTVSDTLSLEPDLTPLAPQINQVSGLGRVADFSETGGLRIGGSQLSQLQSRIMGGQTGQGINQGLGLDVDESISTDTGVNLSNILRGSTDDDRPPPATGGTATDSDGTVRPPPTQQSENREDDTNNTNNTDGTNNPVVNDEELERNLGDEEDSAGGSGGLGVEDVSNMLRSGGQAIGMSEEAMAGVDTAIGLGSIAAESIPIIGQLIGAGILLSGVAKDLMEKKEDPSAQDPTASDIAGGYSDEKGFDAEGIEGGLGGGAGID